MVYIEVHSPRIGFFEATAEEKQKQLLSPPEHLPLLPQYERLFSTNQTQVDEDVNDRASNNDEVGPFTP